MLLFPVIAFSQRQYNIVAISIVQPGLSTGGIIKAKMTVTLTDSTLSVTANNQTQTGKIIKKVDSNYFKVSDGLKESIIKIVEQKNGKYSGFINQESDKGIVSMFFK